MAQRSKIEWTETTWNPVAGCTAVSPGCHNCYAARMALRLAGMHNGVGAKYAGTVRRTRAGRPVFTGRVNLDPGALGEPAKWRRPRTVFVNSMSDLFHEAVSLSFIRRVFATIEAHDHHRFQILTKRPERALELAPRLPWPTNLWLGTSVESQRYITRVATLQQVPARTRFLSCEPLLERLPSLPLERIHWVIVGGESGPGARPLKPEWVREIRDACTARGVAFFFKQWGGVRKWQAGRDLDGRTWDQLPGDLASAAPVLLENGVSDVRGHRLLGGE